MAPHAISPPPHGNGNATNASTSRNPAQEGQRSMLPETKPDDLHDMICVGFGPASLAIAVALHDSIEFGHTRTGGRGNSAPKVAFLEKQSDFAWHAGMQLPGAKMQISWIKDFATMRNPRSQFTFLNYLHSVGRLAAFSDLGTFTPLRIEYEAYMRWCADWFRHVTAYGQEGMEVVPQTSSKGSTVDVQKVDHWLVRTKNLATGEIEERRTKHVVIATGGKGKIPNNLPQSSARVIHSSAYMHQIGSILPEKDKAYRVAVVGAGQSAAEIFHDLQSRYPSCHSRLMIRGGALKPSDDSPFVNQTFDPDHVDDVFQKDPAIRRADILDERATNYGVVRINLLEDIYSDLYEQRVRHPELADEEHQHQILPFRELSQVDELPKGRVLLHVENRTGEHFAKPQDKLTHDTWEADAVIIAAGYERNLHETLLQKAETLMPEGKSAGGRWQIDRNYGVQFKPRAVQDDAGVWLQGCNQETHGLSDTLLSILSIRGGELVDSIFGAA